MATELLASIIMLYSLFRLARGFAGPEHMPQGLTKVEIQVKPCSFLDHLTKRRS